MSHEWFADEVAIDFPSVGHAVERICDRFLGGRTEGEGRSVLQAEVSLSPREASGGLTLAVEVPVRATCPHCGGRGETWTEPCGLCRGTGESRFYRTVRVPVPPGVVDGARLRFRLRSPDATFERVVVRVAIRSSAT
jgi:DnaJ-class molecular chaperone